MDKHRVREVKSVDGKPDPHLFIEMSKDLWIEMNRLPSHDEIENCRIEQEILFNSRSFDIGIIKNWKELGPISK